MVIVAQKSFAHVEAAEAALADLDTEFDGAGLKALRAVVAGYPDMGVVGAGEVAASLFMLIEHLIDEGRIDLDALAVHVKAWRLLLTSEPDAEARAALFAGLKAIRNLHTLPKAA